AVGAVDCCPRAALLTANKSSNATASAANEVIFFLRTMNSTIVQNEKGTLGRTMEIVNLRDRLQRGHCSLSFNSLLFRHFPFLRSHVIVAVSGGVPCQSIKSFSLAVWAAIPKRATRAAARPSQIF